MRTPLTDALSSAGDAPAEGDASRQLAVLFEAAEARENQYAAERLREIYQVAERAMILGREGVRDRAAPPAGGPAWIGKAASVAAGGLLAACAPIVAPTSALLAVACGVAALCAVVIPFRPGAKRDVPALPPPARLDGVVAAADRALQAMVEPQRLALPAPASDRPDEDVLGLLQDALMLGRGSADPEARAVAENAERLARRLGYEPTYEGDADAFETMVDPGLRAPVLLRPALVHADPARTAAGVRAVGAR